MATSVWPVATSDEAEDDGADGEGDGDAKEGAAVADEEDGGGPDEVELLLDGEGPEVEEAHAGREHEVADDFGAKVLQVEKEEPGACPAS